MTSLPAHIEAYLEEAGFTGTEIMILKRLLEHSAMTLRELAARTGKSTGVLDQASKKLLRKNIVMKENINNSPRYTIGSLDAVVDWVQKDMLKKRDTLKRKHEDFENFIATLKIDKQRPDMEHFEGVEGMQGAYMKLLDLGSEILRYVPLTTKEEDDPLHEFRLLLFRRRRTRKIFERVIAHDTVLGRRFQSRDAYEYRETVLVPADKHPFICEKVIVGNTYAYFDHQNQKACFIHFPELARSERKQFDALWNTAKSVPADAPHATVAVEPEISLQTKTLSALREFLLSRKSIAAFGICAFFAAIITFGLYRHNVYLNTQRLRERAVAIASTSALQFHSENIDQLRTLQDIQKPAYGTVVQKLQNIQQKNEDIIYAYIFRPTGTKNMFEFVAANDGFDPFNPPDINGDGILDEIDEVVTPGEQYDVSNIDVLAEGLYINPIASKNPYIDQWGTFISGFAPIFRADGEISAIVGIDIEASHIEDLTRKTFKFLYWFFGLFFAFVFIRFHASNRSLFKDVVTVFCTKETALVFGLCALMATVVTWGFYARTVQLNINRVGDQVKAIAATAAHDFSTIDLSRIQTQEDMYTEDYQRVFEKLNVIRDSNPDIVYTYILRKRADDTFEFVADAHSHPSLPVWVDTNSDGITNPSEVSVVPGELYDTELDILHEALAQGAVADAVPIKDQWGTFISGFAPIKNASGATVAVLGIDRNADDVYELSKNTFTPFYYFFGFFVLFLFTRFNAFNASFYEHAKRILRSKF